MIRPEYD